MAGAITGAVGIVSNIAGGLAANAASSGDINAGTNAINQAYTQLQNIGLPPNIAQPIIYNQFKQAGILTPELEQTINQHPSLAATATGNQQAQNAQQQALQILQQTGQTGMTPQSQAALNQIRQQVAQDTQSKQAQILQQFQSQGQGGSGAQLLAELQGAQSGANQESTAGNQVGAMASQNALQAIGQAGTLGDQIQQQQFGEQFQKGQAQDVINQFNTQNQLGVQAANTQAQNQAQASNLQNAQQLGNANTQQANQELLRQNQAENQQYLETLQRAQAIDQGAAGYNNQMQAAGAQAGAAAAAPYAAIGAGLTTLGGNMSSSSNNNNGQPTSVTPNEATTLDNGMFTGGLVKRYADGTSDAKSNPQDSFLDSVRKAFAAPSPAPTQTPQDSQQEKYRKIREEAAQQFGHSAAGYARGSSEITPSFSRNQTTDYRQGGMVPGKAQLPGDHPQNDTVPAMLSPGEEVIPRSLAKSPFGKKLAKLLEVHHEVMDHAKKHGVQ